MWKNSIVEPVSTQITIQLIRIAFHIPKATNTHLNYIIFIDFQMLQWLHECTSNLHYKGVVYTA
jgi:hypothetical protein